MTTSSRLIAMVACIAMIACSKKSAPKSAAKAAPKGAATSAKAAANKGASQGAVKAQVPQDVALTLDKNVVAWVSIRSFGSLFDAIDTVAGQLKMKPPGASLRTGALEDLTRLTAANGVKGYAWLDQNRPIHLALQDDVPGEMMAGLVVMLPTNDSQKALAAFSAAKRGAEAKGHAALLAVGVRTVYLDVVPGYLVASDRPERFKKVQGFAKRLAAFKPPSLVYMGVAVSELAKTQQLILSMLMAQLEKQVGKDSGLNNQKLKRWLTELERVEVTVDASRDFVTFGSRMTPKPGTELAKEFNRGRGRDASSIAGILPGNSLMTFLSSQKAESDDAQVKIAFEALLSELEIDPAHRPILEKDIKTLASLQDGSMLATLYPDGKSGLGFASAVGSRDPKAFVAAMYRLASHVLVGLAALDAKDASAADKKALAALKKQQLQALLDIYGPEMKEDGVTVRLNHNTSDGVSCDVLDFEFDAKKLPKDDFAKGLIQAMGSKTSAVCCAGAKRSVVAFGASALEQGRRIAAGKPGGLASAPVFKTTLARAPASPTMFMYANVGAMLRNMQTLLPKPISLPTDRALGAGCGYRTRSFSCTLDVPLSLVELISAEMREK